MPRKSLKISILFLMLVLLTGGVINRAQAESPVFLPGAIEGEGTSFAITDSEYLNVILQSDQPIKVLFGSVPRLISMNLEPITGFTASATLTISGMEPNKQYYLYQDSHANRTDFVSDAQGAYSWTQDISVPHHVFIMETVATTYIYQNTVLDHDISGTVEIAANNVTLDCAGHSITGTGSGYGSYINQKENITIKNCNIRDFTYGLYLNSASNVHIENIASSHNFYVGAYFQSSSNSVVQNSRFNYNGDIPNDMGGGIFDIESSGSQFVSNTFSSNYYGIFGYRSSGLTTTNNQMEYNGAHGIYLFQFTSSPVNPPHISENTLIGNNGGILVDYYPGAIIENNTLNYTQFIIVHSSPSALIRGNSISGYLYGISVYDSHNSSIIGNQIIGRGHSEDFDYSIDISQSDEVLVKDNDLSYSRKGLLLYDSNDALIYHNNFIDLIEPVVILSGGTGHQFDNGYPSGGNFYSNYSGRDFYSGSNQDQPGRDGIIDEPYVFAGGRDRYPFVSENGWVGPELVISNPGQYRYGGYQPLPTDRPYTDGDAYFKATVLDPEGEQVKLEVEVIPIGQFFTGTPNFASSFVPSGQSAEVSTIKADGSPAEKLGLPSGEYKWRYRATDASGNTSEWQDYGLANDVDFVLKVVPLYTQVRSDYPSIEETESWLGENYADGENIQYTCGRKIWECGCAVTSSVMVGRYYGITAVDGLNIGEDVNPKNINDWLKANNGYYKSGKLRGDLNWDKAAIYLTHYVDGQKWGLKYDNIHNKDKALDQSRLSSGWPIIPRLNVIGHFFVADEYVQTSTGQYEYVIKDPYFYETRTLDQDKDNNPNIYDYNNYYDNSRFLAYVNKSQVGAITPMNLTLSSPAELLVTDPLGRRLGKDPVSGTEYDEIPKAAYFEEYAIGANSETSESAKVIRIQEPLAGRYRVGVIGTGEGEYHLYGDTYDNQENFYEYNFSGNISAGKVSGYVFDFDAENPGNIILAPVTDIDPPVIHHTSLQSKYLLNSPAITFNYSATDEGSEISSLIAILDGQPFNSGNSINFIRSGHHIITITATNNVGNITTETIEFNVTYAFSGFLDPIKSDGSGLYKQGRTLSVKFRLADANGNYISNAVAHLYIAKIQDGVIGTDEMVLSTSAADTGNLFRCVGQQYIYNLSTDTLSVGTWQLKAVLDDGKIYTVLISIR